MLKADAMRGWLRSRGAVALLGAGLLALQSAPGVGQTALVFDPDSEQVFYAEQADRKWFPASLTKLMTAYVAFDVMRERDISGLMHVAMTELANSQEPTKLWLRTDTETKLYDFIGAMIVKSANDAAVVVAESIGQSLARFTPYGACMPPSGEAKARSADVSRVAPPAPMEVFKQRKTGLGAARYDNATHAWSQCRYDAFIRRMNATARRLGMMHTVFTNANGLPDSRQMTTARDMARLSQALYRDFPEHAPVFAKRFYRFRGGRLRSYNTFLRLFEGADGMKTGFICAAGYNIVASATRDGRRVIAVLMGWSNASTRNADAVSMITDGFALTPARIGPRAVSLNELEVSGNPNFAPPDVRLRLRARTCRTRIHRLRRKQQLLAARAAKRARARLKKPPRPRFKPRPPRINKKRVRRRKATRKVSRKAGLKARQNRRFQRRNLPRKVQNRR